MADFLATVNLKSLRHFCVVATELNLRRAAEQLHIAQPALSVSIAQLESRLGARLFVRGRRGVTLTEAGALLLPEAMQILRHAERLPFLARDAASGDVGTLRLAFVGSAPYRLLPQALPQLQRAHPGVHVELYEATTDRIVEGLHNRTFDLGIVRYPLDAFPGLELELVDEDGFCVALPHDHALVAAGEISLRDLADEPLLLPPREHSPPLRALMLEGFQAQGIMPRIANHMATQTATVLALVEMGAGIALVPQSIVGRVGYRVAFRPLAPGSRFRTGLALLSSPDHHTTLADHFRRAIRQSLR